MARKTTRDWIEIDLDGSIDEAIDTLTALKKDYPAGSIRLDNYMEYGESYSRLRLDFERPKEPVEIEYDMWREKLARYSELARAEQTFVAEGAAYPRKAELDALAEELGAWAGTGWPHRFGSLTIYSGELVMHDMMRGGFRRDGTWVFRTLFPGMDDEPANPASAAPVTTTA